MLPLFITNALEDKSLPVYGDGLNVRDWIHVEDHVRALLDLMDVEGVEGEVFNVGTGEERTILEMANAVLECLDKPQDLIEKVRAAGDRAHERAWPLPLWDEHKQQIKGDVGDLKNTGGREAGSITAAALLSYFVGETPWAHLDIAGNEFSSGSQPLAVQGATGFGVRLLLELLRHWR